MVKQLNVIFFICFIIVNIPNTVAAEEKHKTIEKALEAVETESENAKISSELQKEHEKLKYKFGNDPSSRWGKAGHKFTTYYIAKIAGINDYNAHQLAYYSQYPDDEVQFSATVAFFYVLSLNYRYQIMAILHSLHGGDSADVVKRQSDLKNLISKMLDQDAPKYGEIGLVIHAFGDSFSHVYENDDEKKQAFSYGVGHLFHGHEPDHIAYKPQERFLIYACQLYKALSGKISCAEELNSIEEVVGDRLNLRDDELKVFKQLAKNQGFDEYIYKSFEKGAITYIGYQPPFSEAQVVSVITAMEEAFK